MEIKKIKPEDFIYVLELGKELLNHNYFLPRRNDEFINALASYVISYIATKATDGYFVVDANDNKIGMILYSIPNKEYLFDKSILDSDGYKLGVYVKTHKLEPIETQIVKYEIDTMKNSMWMYKKYHKLLINKSEILLLYLKPQFRGMGISTSLMSTFLSELAMAKINDFFLYTTNFYNYNYYEHLKMKKVSSIIYNHSNCPSYISYKIRLPYEGMLFFGSRRDIIKK